MSTLRTDPEAIMRVLQDDSFGPPDKKNCQTYRKIRRPRQP